jgi:hypothetical protein
MLNPKDFDMLYRIRQGIQPRLQNNVNEPPETWVTMRLEHMRELDTILARLLSKSA